uniref:Aquaporin n=1 Tax=Panagrolaimus sp. JU765 TaxID=591449 RepID=A0AC34QYG7_9BILA
MLHDKSERLMERLRDKVNLNNRKIVNLISEFYATALLLFIGIGIVSQLILSHEKMNTWIQINIGWGFALTLCVLMTSRTSGGLVNPAVSFLFYTFGRLSFIDMVLYCIVQTAGAFFGTALSYLVYYDQIQHFTGGVQTVTGPNATAALFTTFPPAHLSNCGAFIDQVAGTAILTTFVAAIIDKRNKVPDYLHSLLFGLTLIVIGTAYGMNLGYPINPARDLGPRIFAYVVGYGSEVFTYHGYYFWIPVVAPFFGALLGFWLYMLLVGFQIPDEMKPIKLDLDKESVHDRLNGA